jgi:hypothetical protein
MVPKRFVSSSQLVLCISALSFIFAIPNATGFENGKKTSLPEFDKQIISTPLARIPQPEIYEHQISSVPKNGADLVGRRVESSLSMLVRREGLSISARVTGSDGRPVAVQDDMLRVPEQSMFGLTKTETVGTRSRLAIYPPKRLKD